MNIKKTMTYDAGNHVFGLGHAHICDGVKLLDLPQINTYTKILTFGKEEHEKDHDISRWISLFIIGSPKVIQI
jgi:hypothetical protein